MYITKRCANLSKAAIWGAVGLACLGGSLTHAQSENTAREKTSSVDAATSTTEPKRWLEKSAFDREFGIAFYGLGQFGPYLGGGGGVRLRWEPIDWLGFESFLEYASVENDGAPRHDIPNGVQAYVPIVLVKDTLRIMPKIGFCDVISLIENDNTGTAGSNDIMVGAHVALGVELSLGRFSSAFIDAKFTGYAAHNRYAGGWGSGIDGDLVFLPVFQVQAGMNLLL